MAASESTEHFDRFDNADAARDYVAEREEAQREREQEHLELYGEAMELFQNRVYDTFTVERHGTEIAFYRPVGATNADLGDLGDRELARRLKRGARLLEKFEERQLETIQSLQSDDVDLSELYDEALEGTTLQRRILSTHAVDESFQDPEVWTVIFRDDDVVSEVFEDFLAEGEPEKKQRKLDALQSLTSGPNSSS